MLQGEPMLVAEPPSQSEKTNMCKFHSVPSGGIFKIAVSHDASEICGMRLKWNQKIFLAAGDLQAFSMLVTLHGVASKLSASRSMHRKHSNQFLGIQSQVKILQELEEKTNGLCQDLGFSLASKNASNVAVVSIYRKMLPDPLD
jgi:hypothetical protein